MMRRLHLWVALGAGLAVILAGTAYILLRDQRWDSTAAVTLTPATTSPADPSTLFDSFDRSGTMGTYVELISSADTLDRAGSPPVSVEVRAVPDTRVIDVTATGKRDGVQPALTRLIDASIALQPRLGDVWSLSVIENPSEPAKAGPSNLLLFLAIPLLAALAAVASAVLARELGIPASASPDQSRRNRKQKTAGDRLGVGSESGDGAPNP